MKLKRLDRKIIESFRSYGMYFDYLLPLHNDSALYADDIINNTIKIESARIFITTDYWRRRRRL